MKSPRLLAPLAILLAGALSAAGCGSSSSSASSGGSGSSKINLVAYSTPQEAYAKLIPAFQATAAGQGTSFSESYGPSGDQARAVVGGQPADFVEFSLAPDVDKLADAGLVAKNWDAGAHHGFVTDSVVALVVRKGNPRHITGWDDLLKPGLKVVTPNVFSSGSAKWNVMAAYGAFLKEGGSPAQAKAKLAQLFKNVAVQPKSGRDALQTFAGGEGDVLISYENEAITAQQKDQPVDYVVPPQTILIQNPAAVTTKAGAKAKAFLAFLHTPRAQRIFAAAGYRPVVSSLVDTKRFPTPKQLFTIDSLGGWTKVNTAFFDPTSSVMATIERQLGVSTGG